MLKYSGTTDPFQDDDDYGEHLSILQNITGIDQVNPSNNVMFASLLLLGIALSCFIIGMCVCSKLKSIIFNISL